MSSPTVKQTAQRLYDHTEIKTRNDGTEFVSFNTLNGERDADYQSLVAMTSAANDSVDYESSYTFVRDLLGRIADYYKLDDELDITTFVENAEELIDDVADIYTHSLFKWVALGNWDYIDQANAEFGEDMDVVQAAMYGQETAYRDVLSAIVQHWPATETDDDDQ